MFSSPPKPQKLSEDDKILSFHFDSLKKECYNVKVKNSTLIEQQCTIYVGWNILHYYQEKTIDGIHQDLTLHSRLLAGIVSQRFGESQPSKNKK